MRLARSLITLGLFVGVFLLGGSTRAAAQGWDNKGWVLLGEQEVGGRTRADKDRITVGRHEGTFSKVTVVVENSDLEMIGFRIEFADKTEYRPKVSNIFKEGQRTKVIDLPPSQKAGIAFVDFEYRNLAGGGKAKVGVWGWRSGAATTGFVVPPRATWDSKGWVMLGERDVDGRVDRDRIDVGRAEGKFSKLTVVVENSDLEMLEFKVQFSDRTEYNPKVAQYFKEHTRTRLIDMPPSSQMIRYIDFKYRNLAGGGKAKVQVWGWKTAEATPVPARAWDASGWVMLGERVVDGRRRADNNTITVGRKEGKFAKLTIVVLDSDLEMIQMAVKFRRGEPWKPDVAQIFRENARSRVIDLPGDQDRVIQAIDFKYKNLPGGGKARVQVWAK
ncbi:MAG: hypothetical protein H0T79_24450 [Deltaproteobacteria bacterium]|nr:hypothetical protein [Deltaproteobacteria bacterium]